MEPDNLRDDPVLGEIVRRLVQAYEPERIYLFGSKARGDAGPDSDYDLMLIVPDNAPPERRRSRMAYEALRGTGHAADVLVWTRTSFDSRLCVRASLPAIVASEGRLSMPHDPARVAEARGRLARATSDLRAAEQEFLATPPLLDVIAFHCQQIAEKALKGLLDSRWRI